MPSESFSRDIEVPATDEDVWGVVTNVDVLASWISVLGDVTVISELEQYTAVLNDRIGRFSLSAELDIRIRELEKPKFLVVTMRGEDRHVQSRIGVDARLNLESKGFDATLVNITGQYEVSGTVATLGAGAIRKKAAKVLEDFFTNLERHFD